MKTSGKKSEAKIGRKTTAKPVTADAAQVARVYYAWLDAVNAARRTTRHPLFDETLLAWGIVRFQKQGVKIGLDVEGELQKLHEQRKANAAQWRIFFQRCKDIVQFIGREKTEDEQARFILACGYGMFPSFKGAFPPFPFPCIEDRENRRTARNVFAQLRLMIQGELHAEAVKHWRRLEDDYYKLCPNGEEPSEAIRPKLLLDRIKAKQNKCVYKTFVAQFEALAGTFGEDTRKEQLQRCANWLKAEKADGRTYSFERAVLEYKDQMKAETERGGYPGDGIALAQELRRIAKDEKQGKPNKYGICGIGEFLKNGRGRPSENGKGAKQ